VNGAGKVGLGVIAGVMAFAGLGPIAALIVVWFLLSPDGVAETARAGGAGAVLAAAKAGYGSLAREWQRGGPARRRRRSERRDRWNAAGGVRGRLLDAEHGLVLVGRAFSTGVAAAVLAARAVPGAWRDALAAVQTRRHPDDFPERAQETETDSVSDAAAGPGESGAGSAPDGDTAAPTNPGSQPAAGQPEPPAPTTGETVTENSTSTNTGSELKTAADWEAWATWLKAVIEEASVLAVLLTDFQIALPEAYAASHATDENGESAGPKTKKLDEAVQAITEAGDMEAYGEALTGLRLAADEAADFGDDFDSIGATGGGNHTRGYVAN
jgi:hypothetical protein